MDFSDCACSGKTLGRLVQPAVMALLCRQPLHGYLIVRQLGQLAMFASQRPDPTGVYRQLKAMEDDGLVSGTWDVGDGGPAKRRFELTQRGHACLRQWRQTLDAYAHDILDLLTTIDRASPPTAAACHCAPKSTFSLGDQTIDSIDLKVLLLSRGMYVRPEVFEALGTTHRISPDPYECSSLILPDQTVVHIADVGPSAEFHLAVGPGRTPRLLYGDQIVAEVSLPPVTAFYRQVASSGTPFRGMAILQGLDVLTFPYLWSCDYAKAGHACRFCHCGNLTQMQWAAGNQQEVVFSPRDVAEAVHYAVNVERCARYVQLTGGSSFNPDGECGRTIQVLRAIDDLAGLDSIPGQLIVYTTPPAHTAEIDRLFDAGADCVACDIEIWDEDLARQICPGKSRWTGRQRHLDTLLYVAQRYGRGKALSTFVVGLEPAESFLAGAEYLASHGVVPIPSVWMPHGLPRYTGFEATDLGFYRQICTGLAEIYERHQCQPPGDRGFNVCLCRDTWNRRQAILAGGSCAPRLSSP